SHYPRATAYIPQMIDIIGRLIDKGHAYEVGGTVYYDIASFPAYGRLSRNSTDSLLAGTRGELDPRKRHPGDFTLWKAAGEHLLLKGTRMAKSAGNFFRVTEVAEQGFDPLAFRYLMLQAKYRTKLNFSVEGLAGADRALAQLRERVREWSSGPDGAAADYDARFRAALDDDLDLPSAMALVSELARADVAPRAKARLLQDWDRVLGLDLGREQPVAKLPDGAAELLAARDRARAARDFATSDRLRRSLAAMGVQVVDTPEGQQWKPATLRRERN